MNLELYQDMRKRTPFISLMGMFFSQLKAKNISLSSYGLVETDSQVMFIFFVLRYVMERSLQELHCTLGDISRFILELNADLFHLPLDEEQAYNLGSLIIYDIFCNQGEPIVFNPLPGQNEYRTYPTYITSEVIYDEEGKKDISFKMDDDGFKLMLSTREMEENMEIKISSIIFNLKLEKQDYKGALAEIQHSFQLIKIRQLNIEEKILQIRSNALSVSIPEYRRQFEETYELLDETRSNFMTREKGIEIQLSEYRNNPETASADSEQFKNLELLEKIKDQLDQSLMVFAKVMTALMNFSREYSEQNDYQLRTSTINRYSFNKLLYDKVLDDARLLEEVDLFFHPLLRRPPKKRVQLTHPFSYRKLLKSTETTEQEWVEDGIDEQKLLEEKKAAQKKTKELEHSMSLMIEALVTSKTRSLNLQDFYANLPEGFLPTMDEAREFFTFWSMLDDVSLDQLDKESEMMIFDDPGNFNFAYSLACELKKYPLVQAYQTLSVRKTEGTIEKMYEEGPMKLAFMMDNLEIRLKGALRG